MFKSRDREGAQADEISLEPLRAVSVTQINLMTVPYPKSKMVYDSGLPVSYARGEEWKAISPSKSAFNANAALIDAVFNVTYHVGITMNHCRIVDEVKTMPSRLPF